MRCITIFIKHRLRSSTNFIFEHKSYFPDRIELQLLQYLLDGYNFQLQESKQLTQIIPVVVYHGKRPWKGGVLSDYMSLNADFLKKYRPDFQYMLIDLADYSDEVIAAIESGFILNKILLLFKHKGDAEFVVRNCKNLFIFDSEVLSQDEINAYNQVILMYILGAFKKKKEKFNEIIEMMPHDLKSKAMNTFDLWLLEGREIGKEIGKEINEIQQNISYSLNATLYFPEKSVEELSAFTKINPAFIRKIQKGFESGSEDKARKVVNALFAKFETLSEKENKEIDAIIQEFLPKFKEVKANQHKQNN
ncbi:MAG: hypothetical protein ACI9XO_004434 [Paraglaciecola sp.]